ncbi:MAG: isoprenoid biosynthesis glyoxalase ElbB [Chitinophagales bacterium]
MKVAVLLSGSGVYDGSEIHETVLTLLAIEKNGAEWFGIAPNINQHHVVNHLNGEEMDEKRNVLIESARIARGNVKDLKEVSADDFDALAIPGGFGAAKNLTKWAFSGPEGEIDLEVKRIINETIEARKPIAAMCMGPTVIAKALQGSKLKAKLTVGTTEEKSPYDIKAISQGMETAGAVAEMKTVQEQVIDEKLKIVSTPCYMMDTSVAEIAASIDATIKRMMELG